MTQVVVHSHELARQSQLNVRFNWCYAASLEFVVNLVQNKIKHLICVDGKK